MDHDDDLSKKQQRSWQQYFPTYRFSDDKIVLKEFEAAVSCLESEERVFVLAVQITLVLTAALGSLVVGGAGNLVSTFLPVMPEQWTLSILIGLICAFTWATLHYFADRRRAVVFSSRKVIVLRRMLGLSYGTQQLVLPNWRIEGADEPFVVRMFPGWTTHVLYPFWILIVFSFVVLTFLTSSLFFALAHAEHSFALASHQWGVTIAFVWSICCAVSYRKALFDTHETLRLWFARFFSGLIRVKLESNFENVLYRAKLAVFEMERLKIRLDSLRKLLVFIEDRQFWRHRGISYRGLLRAAAGFLRRRRRSGGSTITQQLGRSLFIRDYHKTVRRKLVEILLAPWLEQVLAKQAILDLYLGCVRFETQVYGVLAAMRHFLGKHLEKATQAEAFFLVERVSNIRPRVLEPKVDETLRNAVANGILTREDANAVVDIYQQQVEVGQLRVSDEQAFERLCQKWRTT